jgi:hypothetical protein
VPPGGADLTLGGGVMIGEGEHDGEAAERGDHGDDHGKSF